MSKEDKYTFALNELCGYLGKKEINKIEAYDVSHISGKNGVASCVVFSKLDQKRKNIDFLIYQMLYQETMLVLLSMF